MEEQNVLNIKTKSLYNRMAIFLRKIARKLIDVELRLEKT